VANRALTAAQNALLGSDLSEFHTGYRAWSRGVLLRLPLPLLFRRFHFRQSDDHASDGEISTRYFPEASSIGFASSVKYGLGVLKTSALYRLHHWRLREASFLTDNPAMRIDRAPTLIASGRSP
jgi:hypothetical protein